MLLRCLKSLKALREPTDVRLSIVVVDNEPEPASAVLVASLPTDDPHIFYHHEPRRGIASARNAVLDKAAEIGADWIAMLDDDQFVADEWLFWMWQAATGEKADVVQSALEPRYPTPVPAWAFPKRKRRAWRHDADHASSGGVLFRAGLKDRNGAALRFDEAFALTGGEDRDFFTRAVRGGAMIVWTPEAVAYEVIPPSKLTYREQVFRAYWIEAVNARQDVQLRGWLPTLVGKAAKLTGAVLNGIAAVAVYPFAAPLDRRRGRKHLLKGSVQFAKAAGIAVGLAGLRGPKPYRIIHGG